MILKKILHLQAYVSNACNKIQIQEACSVKSRKKNVNGEKNIMHVHVS